jgi:ATP-dependent exoDNAse (exonuclease V) beta subunit
MMQLGDSDAGLNEALSLVLLHRDGNLTQCRELLADMLSLRDQWGRLIPLDKESLEDTFLDGKVLTQVENALDSAICAELTRLQRVFPVDLLERLSALAGEMGHEDGYQGRPSPIVICSGRYKSPEATAVDLEYWRALTHLLLKKDGWRSGFNINHVEFAITKEQRSRLREIVDSLQRHGGLLEAVERVRDLPPAKYPAEQWKVAKALFHVLHRALAELQIVFAERRECDFTELGLLARAALHHGGGALDTALGTKLQHMLVDEMQDTSTSQYELIQLLTQGWDGRSQTVFLVGDPKQSIYLFRQARVERFIRTMEELHLGDLILGSLRLTANFRSQPGLVHSFNGDFSRLFPKAIEDDRSEMVPYSAVDAVRGPVLQETHSSVWHPQVVSSDIPQDDRRTARRKLARLEAQTIRRLIEHWRAKPLPAERIAAWKVAVLVRSRSHLTHIVAELKRDNGSGAVPFRAVDIEPLAERPEVLDLFALTRALLHPADRVAWLAVLRAPWCGLELAALHALCGADDPAWAEHTVAELISERGHELDEYSIGKLQKIWPVLLAAGGQRSRLALSELVERTWHSLGGDAYLAEEERSNARRYFALLDEAEQQAATVDLSLLKQRLGQLYAAPSTAPGAVDLMTIHGAKGLEWDVVLLPGLERRSRSSYGRLLVWDELTSTNAQASQVVLAPIVCKGRDSEALNDWLNNIHKRREAAECKRLFYVACTRAREELHLFATLEKRSDQTLKPAIGSLLEAAWPIAEEHFVDRNASSKPLIAPIVTLPHPTSDNLVLPSLAAGNEEPVTRAATLYRLPIDFHPTHQQPVASRSSTHRDATVAAAPFERPEGSFEARALGNAVHAFLELLAHRLAAGNSAELLLDEIALWQPRIEALLRNYGLSPSMAQRLVPRVRQALDATLRHPEGLWVLSPHREAASERALTTWEEERSSVRLDRIFRAGEAPFVQGEEHLWIIDFKTTQHSGAGTDSFLEREREKYAPQMAAYAKVLRDSTETHTLRMGLYYPMLSKLIWWEQPNE